MSYIPKNNLVKTGLVPDLDMSNYSQERLTEYIEELKTGSTGRIYPFVLPKVSTNTTLFAYFGGVYAPSQNRIYIVPRVKSSENEWFYVDCNTGKIVGYTYTVVASILVQYNGGVYSPTENRIYLVPNQFANIESKWHYIDCSNDNEENVVEYTHGATVTDYAYNGGVYSPTENRIYFIPAFISGSGTWHYVDCNTGAIVGYNHAFGATLSENVFKGGCYSPTENKIYLIPHAESDETKWHYIDCSGVTDVNLIVEYSHSLGTLPVNNAYEGGVYSPTQNRIYMVPLGQADQDNWHYIDCNDGSINEYPNTSGITSDSLENYSYGIYSPVDNNIYFCPNNSYNVSVWHYINCDDGTIGSYTHGINTANITNGTGGVFSPTENKIYFISNSLFVPNFYGLYLLADRHPSQVLMANGMFNKL
jgi:hypothetical protein